MIDSRFTAVDLFSGCGGMSYGFHKHPAFKILAAADAELGKPSSPAGSLKCNSTYELNMGISPKRLNLAAVEPGDLRKQLGLGASEKIHVLLCCPPCTGFSRANPDNHISNDHRNSLVAKAAFFAAALQPDIVLMENAREVLTGNFPEHFETFSERMIAQGYRIKAAVHRLDRFGLPQIRERSLVIAIRKGLGKVRTLTDLWEGASICPDALTVRNALDFTNREGDMANRHPTFNSPMLKARMAAIPKNGGSWIDLTRTARGRKLMTPAMLKIVEAGKIGSHPDVYGRMSWERPAPTIKRECAHVGNGRYAHPEEDRLLTVREMARLQGFPLEFRFGGNALSNQYRHIGDAVPPLISHQLAHVAHWMLTEKRPELKDTFLAGTHLQARDVEHCLA